MASKPNYDKYNWMLKTYGMPAAEWYLENPTQKPGANPFLPKGAYVPQASTGGKEETYASASSDIIQDSVIEPDSAGDSFQQFLNSLNAEQKAELESLGELTAEDKANLGSDYISRQKQSILESPFANSEKDQYGNYRIPTADPLLAYDPNYGQYGGYFTKENLGFSPLSVLYSRYEDWAKNNPVPDQETMVLRAIRNDPTLGGTAGYNPDGSYYRLSLDNEDLRKLAEYDDAVAAQSRALDALYKTPLSKLQYKSYSDAPSLQAFRDQFSSLGIDIPLMSDDRRYFVRAATEQDPEVQKFGIQNVGRQDYRQQRQPQQESSQEIQLSEPENFNKFVENFEDKLIAQSRGESPFTEEEPRTGPRGEDLGDVAVQYGDGFPKTPGWMKQLDREYNQIKNKPTSPGPVRGSGRGSLDTWEGPVREASAPPPVDVRIASAEAKSDVYKQDLARQSEYDLAKEKQRAAAETAQRYRESAANQDPFRSGAFS